MTVSQTSMKSRTGLLTQEAEAAISRAKRFLNDSDEQISSLKKRRVECSDRVNALIRSQTCRKVEFNLLCLSSKINVFSKAPTSEGSIYREKIFFGFLRREELIRAAFTCKRWAVAASHVLARNNSSCTFFEPRRWSRPIGILSTVDKKSLDLSDKLFVTLVLGASCSLTSFLQIPCPPALPRTLQLVISPALSTGDFPSFD